MELDPSSTHIHTSPSSGLIHATTFRGKTLLPKINKISHKKRAPVGWNALIQGRHHKVLIGGGGGGRNTGSIGRQTHLPPIFSFSSDFRPLYFENENVGKWNNVKRFKKKSLKYKK